jgi:FkbM family methyltransferase
VSFETVNGFMWPAEDRHCRAIIFDHVHQIERVMKHVKGRELCVQAGGNCGVFPKEFAKHFRSVHTFEMQADNFRCLQTNVPELNVDKYHAALGAKRGTVKAVLPENEANNCGAFYMADGQESVLIMLDDLNLPALDLLYLDVEGAEGEVILGAKDTIEQFKPIIVIEDKGLDTRFGFRPALPLLESMGYRIVEELGNDKVLECH